VNKQMSERLVVPVPVFAALLLAVAFTSALAAHVTPVEIGFRCKVFSGAHSRRYSQQHLDISK